MATEATEQLNELIARIDAADHQIDQARVKIHEVCGTFDGLFAHPSWEEESQLPELDHHLAETAAVIEHASHEVATHLGATIEKGSALLQQQGSDLQTMLTTWEAQKANVLHACELFEQGLQKANHRIDDSYQKLDHEVELAGQALQSAGQTLDTAYREWEKATSGDMMHRLDERFRTMVSQITDGETHKVEQHLRDAEHQSGAAIQRLLHAGTQLLNDLSHMLGEGMEQMRHHLSDEVNARLHDAAQTLTETALREILHSIMEIIATSELGVEITAAMSPVLPELIAAKKLTDAILSAIRLWKDSIGRLTDPFNMF